MQLKSYAAGASLMAILLFPACSNEPEVTSTVSELAVTPPDAVAPAPSIIETPPPAVETADAVEAPTPIATPAPAATAQVEQVPSVMRRTNPAAAAPVQQQVTATFPPRVSVTQLREMLDEGTAVVVDSRDRVSFAIEHIPGSINIPEQESTSRASELPKGKTIVTYCA